MTDLYQTFKNLSINFSAIGLEPTPNTSDYFCTPKGAKIIGWAGVDGIHYCFIEGFGDMVFAVSPCNLPGDYVHPLAESFEDFLRLMLMCSGLDAIEQAHGWNKDTFEEYMAKKRVSPEEKEIHYTISEELHLTPMDFPFEYIKNLQSRFNYTSIPWKDEYREYVPEERSEVCLSTGEEEETKQEIPWQVYFGEGIWHQHSKDKPGTEISVNKQFAWNGNVFRVPSVYVCNKGLVIDFCVEIEPSKIKEFLEKIEKYVDREDKWSNEILEEMHHTNPTNIDFRAEAVVNQKQLRQSNGIGFGWMPESLRPEEGGWANEPEIEQVIEHYGLDRTRGWSFHRTSFAWTTIRKPTVKSLNLTMKAEEVSVVAKRFITPEIGESITITRPATGETFVLTVEETEDRQMDNKQMERLHHGELEFPTHYKTMTYILSPDLPGTRFLIQDTKSSDRPRPKPQKENASGNNAAAAISIIGGADGPTSVFLLSNGSSRRPHSACSALTFEPAEEVEWKAVFREKPCGDMKIDLL